ncbi:MAG: histidine kinase [Melioribacteraceae bacterium]|nr:histidine kinase [Melioribacteraceae bacterium]MCF8353723.1 histidine kinase [Melioribacteraceae bacterium]MCF8394976.1 histidine kinase [Melioribacteraceae bacterium]MCF8418639.1 histidine kinase [Melioribacteraceae bacterium]
MFSESIHFGFITFGKATLEDIMVGIARDNVVFIGWSGLYFGIKFWMSWISQKEMTDKALSLARNAQLEMLRYQLNPHFLFNTLSSLRALTSDDNKKAKEIITKISEFLRYSLIESENNEVPLSKEIEVIKNYLDIEKVRFEDELEVDFDIEQIAEVYPVPIFLIHPLVENAIKHGMQTSPIPLKILISAKMSNGYLNIRVFNTGKWVDTIKETNTGRGIDNIKRRLKIYAPRQHSFQVMKNTDSVEVNISIRK